MLNTYVLIGHVPVRPLPVRHDFPHDDPVAPHVTGGGELPVLDGFGRSPSDWNLPSLQKKKPQNTKGDNLSEGSETKNATVTVFCFWREAPFTVTTVGVGGNLSWRVDTTKPLGEECRT